MIFNLMKIIFLSIVIAIMTCGCISEPIVESTKNWEGHYFNTNDFMKATKDIQLDKDESIWVLSNNTLKRLLKNTEK